MTTFLFTDIEGSTQKWEKHGEAMREVLSRHDAILNEVIAAYGGTVVSHTGDGVFAAFESGDPLPCAWAIQRRFQTELFAPVGEVRVRCALHTGTAEKRGANYFGADVNLVARVLSAGHGGQILLTGAAAVLPLPAGAELRDLGHHQLKDIFQPAHILELTHPGLRLNEFPALKTLSNRPNNLPRQATPFFGRETELEAIDRMLADPACRLITLLGPGGMGKSRLSIEAGANALDQFPQGVWFVPLASLIEPGQIIAKVAEALRINFAQNGDPKLQVLSFLRERKLLLILDNFEHLTAGAVFLDDVLRECPEVKALCSSRERLNLGIEMIVAIHGLDYPRGQDLESFGAVKLFLDNAHRVKPGYNLTPVDGVALVKLCGLLDGMPLGLELAAAWVRVIPLPEIVKRVEANLGFLASSRKDLPERHRSIKAVFDYSWNLLSESERDVLAKLSVFKGGFELDAAEQVAGADPFTLAALVDKSQIKVVGAGRYGIHELIRQFAREALRSAGRERDTLNAHSTYYCIYMGERENDIRFANQKQALAEFNAEWDNLRQAWVQAVERADLAGVADLAKAGESLGWFCELQGRLAEGLNLVDGARVMLDGSSSFRETPAYGKVMLSLTLLNHASGRTVDNLSLLDSTIALLRRLPAPRELGYLLSMLYSIGFPLGLSKHRDALEEALRIFAEIGERNGQADCLQNLANLDLEVGVTAGVGKLLTESMTIFTDLGNERQMGWGHMSMAKLRKLEGNQSDAMNHLRAAVVHFENINDLIGIGWSISSIGWHLIREGMYDEALPYTTRSLGIFRDVGNQLGIRSDMNNLTALHKMAGTLPQAAEGLIAENMYLAEKVAHKENRGRFYLNAAELSLLSGRVEHAEKLIGLAEDTFRESNDAIGIGACRSVLGSVLMEQGDVDGAGLCFESSIKLYDGKAEANEAYCHLCLGDIALCKNDPASANREHDKARELSRTSGDNDYALGSLVRTALRLQNCGKPQDALRLACFAVYRSRQLSLKIVDFRGLQHSLKMADEILKNPDPAVQAHVSAAQEWARVATYEQAFGLVQQ